MGRNRTFVVAALVVFLVGSVAVGVWAVVSSPARAAAAGSAPPTTSPPATPTVILSPADRATNVAPDRPATVTVEHARLAAVGLSAADGTPVPGTVSPDGRNWHATTALRYGITYHWSGTVLGADGRAVALTGSFATVAPQQTTQATLNIDDGQTVGIAAPIIVQFDQHISDKAAAQRAMQIQTSVPTPGSWAWLPDENGGSRADWRPRNYWQPGTQVAVTIHQFAVDDGAGVWGAQDIDSHFTIGRAEIVKADVNSHQLVVLVNGQQVMSLPASYGLESDPNRNTTNGIHVVMDKAPTVLMSNPAYGYENVPEHWAVRIDNYGEYIHANPETDSVQGSQNVTHGCVNLSTANALRYYNQAIYGDPVEVTGSATPFTPADGDISDWTVPWNQWVAMSALAPAPS